MLLQAVQAPAAWIVAQRALEEERVPHVIWHGYKMPIQLIENADSPLMHVHGRRRATTFGLPDSIEEELKAKASFIRELDVELDIVVNGPHGAILTTAILGQDSHFLVFFEKNTYAAAGLWPQGALPVVDLRAEAQGSALPRGRQCQTGLAGALGAEPERLHPGLHERLPRHAHSACRSFRADGGVVRLEKVACQKKLIRSMRELTKSVYSQTVQEVPATHTPHRSTLTRGGVFCGASEQGLQCSQRGV